MRPESHSKAGAPAYCRALVSLYRHAPLTTAFNLNFTRPLKAGPVTVEGHWASGRRRVFVADVRLIGASGEVAARGTGTFMRSHILLSSFPGYRAEQ